MKVCKKCDTEKHSNGFPKDASRPDGLYPYCKMCHSGYQAAWLAENPTEAAARYDRGLEAARAWRVAHPIEYKEYVRRDALLRRYGITPEQYGLMLSEQNGTCGFVGCEVTPVMERHGVLSVDHDHACSTCGAKKRACGLCIRGLLCFNHNALLGLAHDNQKELTAAIDYLAHPPAHATLKGM